MLYVAKAELNVVAALTIKVLLLFVPSTVLPEALKPLEIVTAAVWVTAAVKFDIARTVSA